jgi:hypothetical protein
MARWRTRILPVAAVVVAAGLAGWVLFLQLTTDVATLPPSAARREFAEIRAGLDPAPPMLVVAPGGEIVRNPAARTGTGGRPRWLRVRVYSTGPERLVRVDLPFWWVRLKGPVFEFALRRAGLDPARLGVTARDLHRHGAGTVLDEEQADGGRVLIWTE